MTKEEREEMGIKTHENGYDYREYEVDNGKDEKVTMRLFNAMSPKRLDDETYEEYKTRQLLVNKQIKKKLKGKLIYALTEETASLGSRGQLIMKPYRKDKS